MAKAKWQDENLSKTDKAVAWLEQFPDGSGKDFTDATGLPLSAFNNAKTKMKKGNKPSPAKAKTTGRVEPVKLTSGVAPAAAANGYTTETGTAAQIRSAKQFAAQVGGIKAAIEVLAALDD